jgi:uncharacterized protein
MAMSISPSPQIVIKVSKYCNLRCDYCYEFPHLGDKARMSQGNIRALFENIKSSIDELAIETVDFIWHGGEPFLLPLDFYEQVAEIQNEVFSGEFKYINSVQTNLTVLTARHVDFLKGGFFTDVGVSFDVYGDQRIDTKGQLRTDTVLGNLQKLIDNRISFGAIAVLAHNTLPKIKEIYRFFDSLHVNHRILAYYRSTGVEQTKRHGVDYDELVGAHKELFFEWLASKNATTVEPIDDYVHYAVSHVTQSRGEPYDASARERVFIVDVSGDVYNVLESYQPEFCYGNLFHSPLAEIVASESRRRSNELSKERMQRFCQRCPYFGACPGMFVARATDVERELLQARGCPVRPVLDHIVGVLERTDLREFILKTYNAEAKTKEHPALSVA